MAQATLRKSASLSQSSRTSPRASSAKASTRRRPSSTKTKQSVRLNIGGPEVALVVGVNHAISLSRGAGPKEVEDDSKDAIAIGLRARSHTSTWRNALAIGMGALAEITAVVSAGPGGRLVIIIPALKGSVSFEQEIDGREFRTGRRYTVSDHGIWSELVEGEGPMSDIVGWEHPPSQVVSVKVVKSSKPYRPPNFPQACVASLLWFSRAKGRQQQTSPIYNLEGFRAHPAGHRICSGAQEKAGFVGLGFDRIDCSCARDVLRLVR